MALSKGQISNARLIYSLGVQRGLNPQRAKELVAAAYKESGLSAKARNKSSGAAGLFQLLSSGYQNRAKRLGGLQNPRANLLAILPAYLKYWRQHPGAAVGAGAAAVEASGQGASWYASPLRLLSALNLEGPARYQQISPHAGQNLESAQITAAKSALLAGLAAGQSVYQTIPQVAAARNAATIPLDAPLSPPKTTQPLSGVPGGVSPTELFYDPLGGIKYGRQIGAIGHHKDHVHVAYQNAQAMLHAIALARQLGLRVSENPYVDHVDPVHVKNSWHYKTFGGRYNGRRLGEAADVSGSPALMAKYYRALAGGR